MNRGIEDAALLLSTLDARDRRSILRDLPADVRGPLASASSTWSRAQHVDLHTLLDRLALRLEGEHETGASASMPAGHLTPADADVEQIRQAIAGTPAWFASAVAALMLDRDRQHVESVLRPAARDAVIRLARQRDRWLAID